MTLIAAANSAMLGLSRLAYSLATNRQIPSWIGRLHPTRSTPFVVIGMAALLAAALVAPLDVEFLVGIFAFGALLGLTIAHLSIVVLRFREPTRPRPFTMPVNVTVRGASIPLPAVVGAIFGALAWVGVVVTHDGARYVGFAWLAGGLLLYVVYRTTQGKSLRAPGRRAGRRAAARARPARRAAVRLDPRPHPRHPARRRHHPDRRAARRRGGRGRLRRAPGRDDRGALGLRGPDVAADRRRAARGAAQAARAPRWRAPRRWGRSTRASRSPRRPSARGARAPRSSRRRAGAACRRSCWPPRSRRGSAAARCSAGAAGPRENFVGDVTKYVVAKAPCQVILTAPPASAMPAMAPAAGVGDRATPGAPGR